MKRFVVIATLCLSGLVLSGCRVQLQPRSDPFYDAMLEANPENEAALYAQGRQKLLQGHMQTAERYFKRLTEANPEMASGWRGLGEASLELGRYPQAEQAFRRSLEIRPSTEARLGLAQVLMLLDRDVEAETIINQVEQEQGVTASIARVRGDLAFVRKNYPLARDFYRQSLALQTDQPQLSRRLDDLEDFISQSAQNP